MTTKLPLLDIEYIGEIAASSFSLMGEDVQFGYSLYST